jgi:3-dehydroquinate synthase
MLHGEAVALGIVAACEISARKSGLSADERNRVIAALQRFALRTRLPAEFPREQILPALQADKKFEKGAIRFVVSPRLGSAFLSSDVTRDDLARAISAL